MDANSPESGGRAAGRLLAAAVGFGILCRLRQYAANTSLWHDEAFVALNVINVSFADLLGPLDWHEPSPPGFVAAEKVMLAVFGRSELALRALPLLAGSAALLVCACVARRACVRARGALWAVVLCAASAKLIADASSVKHFSFDLLIAATLVLLAWMAFSAPTARVGWRLAWGLTGAVGLWFSYASAFVFAGTSFMLAWPATMRQSRAARAAYLAANLAGLTSAAALVGAVSAQRSDAVVQFWARAFPDLTSAPLFALWLGRAVLGFFNYFWQPLGLALFGLALLGGQAYWHADRRVLLGMLWVPVGLALAASLLGWWPFGGNQHMAFAAPALLLVVGDGIEHVRCRLAVRHPRLAAMALVLLLAPGLGGALFHLVVPRQRHEVREAIAFMQQHAAAGDQLAVFDPATFAFYTGRDLRGAPSDFAGAARVWVITPRSPDGSLHADVRRAVERLQRERPRTLALEVHGAAAYCFGPTDAAIRPP